MLVYGRMVWGGYDVDGEFLLPGHDDSQIAALRRTLRINHALGASRLNLSTTTLRISLTVCEVTERVADLLPAASPFDPASQHVWLPIDQAVDRLSHPLNELVRAYGRMTKKIQTGGTSPETSDDDPETS